MEIVWRKVVALPLAGLVLVGQAVIGYVTENGKLPDWMPEKLSWLGSLLAVELKISLWVLVLIVVGMGMVGWWILKSQLLAAKRREERLSLIGNELAICKKQVSAMAEENNELTRQMDVQSFQMVEQRQSEPAFDVQSIEFRVLAAITAGINHGQATTLFYIKSTLNTSNVEAHAAIDVLSALDLVSSSITGKGRIYKLTAKGRKYIVNELKG